MPSLYLRVGLKYIYEYWTKSTYIFLAFVYPSNGTVHITWIWSNQKNWDMRNEEHAVNEDKFQLDGTGSKTLLGWKLWQGTSVRRLRVWTYDRSFFVCMKINVVSIRWHTWDLDRVLEGCWLAPGKVLEGCWDVGTVVGSEPFDLATNISESLEQDEDNENVFVFGWWLDT